MSISLISFYFFRDNVDLLSLSIFSASTHDEPYTVLAAIKLIKLTLWISFLAQHFHLFHGRTRLNVAPFFFLKLFLRSRRISVPKEKINKKCGRIKKEMPTFFVDFKRIGFFDISPNYYFFLPNTLCVCPFFYVWRGFVWFPIDWAENPREALASCQQWPKLGECAVKADVKRERRL